MSSNLTPVSISVEIDYQNDFDDILENNYTNLRLLPQDEFEKQDAYFVELITLRREGEIVPSKTTTPPPQALPPPPPQKIRSPPAMPKSRKAVQQRCSRCGDFGHKKRTCEIRRKNSILPSIAKKNATSPPGVFV